MAIYRGKGKTKAVDILFMRRDFAYKGINPLFLIFFARYSPIIFIAQTVF